MEGNGRGLILGSLPVFALKTHVKIFGVPTEIRIGYAQNRRQVPYRVNYHGLMLLNVFRIYMLPPSSGEKSKTPGNFH
jgi:hypothetical protein